MSPVTAKESLSKAVLAVYIAAKVVLAAFFITNKTERISFKNGCVIWMVKHLKGGWFMGVSYGW